MITTITAIFGAVFGFAALLLNLSSFLRDRSRLKVILQWNNRISGERTPKIAYDQESLYGVVQVTSIGRRPVFVAELGLTLPDRKEPILGNSLQPPQLAEGDPPAMDLVEPALVAVHEKNWKNIRAFAIDSTGRKYTSIKVKKKHRLGHRSYL